MKLLALLFLIFSAASGKVWGYGLSGISVGLDPELLTDTPIPFHHWPATPTNTATPPPAFTPSATASRTGTPMATKPMALPTFTPTITPSVVNPMTSQANRPKPSLSENSFREQVYVEVGLGLDPSLQASTLPGTVVGGKAAIGILFKDGFAVQLDLDYFNQSSAGPLGTQSENKLLVLPTLRRYLLAGGVRPYLSLGSGLAVNTTNLGLTSTSVDSFDLALGAGVEFVIENDFSAYVEGKYNFVFLSSSPNQDIPLTLGARLHLL